MLHLREDAAGGEARVWHRLVAHGPELVRVVVQQLQALALQPALHLKASRHDHSLLPKLQLRAPLPSPLSGLSSLGEVVVLTAATNLAGMNLELHCIDGVELQQ